MSSYLADPFPRFIDHASIQTIFEIGSRDGQDAVALDKHYKPQRVMVFEPNPPAIRLCRTNIGNRPNFKLVEAAVSDVPGPLSFFSVVNSHQADGKETHNIGASSLLRASGLYGETYIQEEIKVNAIRADAACREYAISSVDLLCMDVQGAELSVLRSFGTMLTQVRYIITEATVVNLYKDQVQLHEINDFLCKHGFQLAAVDMPYWGFGNFLYINGKIPVPIVGS